MVVSRQVELWKAESKAESLLQALEARSGALPPELIAAVRAASDFTLMRGWLAEAVRASTLNDFRQTTQI